MVARAESKRPTRAKPKAVTVVVGKEGDNCLARAKAAWSGLEI
jgi:hypothetical protein